MPGLRDIFDQAVLEPVLLSLQTAMAVLVLHLVFGVFFGYLLSKERLPFRLFLDGLVTLPLIFPPIATGFILLLLLGRYGVVGQALATQGMEVVFSKTGVILAAFLSGLPLVTKPVQSAIEQMSGSLKEASFILGKSELETFIRVTLPLIRKVIMAGLMLSVGRSFGEVGITLMLGGNINGKTETISLAIYNAVFEGNFERAMLFAALLALITLGLFFSMNRLAGGRRDVL